MIMCIYICTYIYLFREGDISTHIYIYSTLGLIGENPPVFVMFRAICSELCEGGIQLSNQYIEGGCST